jgi:hypothetical protein
MKKILLFFLVIFFASGSIACPICGCGGSNIYMGLFPDFRRGFMGIRYNHAQYHTTLYSVCKKTHTFFISSRVGF